MLYRYAVLTLTLVLVHENVLAQPFQSLFGQNFQKNEQKQKNVDAMDNVAAADEHHKIVILVPQIIRQEKKKPKHHHHKVIPVVHSGKVIHAHHHHGNVDHVHKHDAKAKHEHKHTGTAAHKHSHFGVGSHTHKHLGKASHDHKHAGKADHKHHHVGKGSIHHHHSKHHHHPHPEPPAPAPPAKPPKKFTGPFYFGDIGGEQYQNAFPRVKIDSEILKALNPASVPFAAPAVVSGKPGRIIQIRIPDENDANAVKEIDIDTGSDVAVLKKNYLSPGEVDGITFTANQDDGEAGDEEDADVSEESYQLGDGYKLAASAAARAQAASQDENVLMFAEQDVAEPSNVVQELGKNNMIAYSDTFHYQY